VPPTTCLITDEIGAGRCLAVVGLAALLATSVSAQRRGVDFRQEPACQTLTTTSMGGPAPKTPTVMVWRWLGASNHELAYRDTVILINAFYRRTPPARPLGFTRDDIKKASAIYVGHAHGDHIADVPYVAGRTGSTVIGAPTVAEQARKMGLPDKQMITVSGHGGEVQKYNGFTVEAVLGRHKNDPPELGRATGAAYRSIMGAAGLARTPDQQELARGGQVGSNDPRITEEGVIAYLFSFDNGYTLIFRDGSGASTEYEQKLMQRIGGRTNVAVVAYTTYVPQIQIPNTLALVKLFHPDVYMPTHHDDTGGGRLDTPTYPMFMAIRDEMPEVQSISPLYRTPVCLDTKSREVFVGK
jgi:L-ascorbate metabolism protein UlaG (beta-lactamase superfamily)